MLRRRLDGWLRSVGCTDRDRFDLLLAADEAFSNAVQHATDPRPRKVDVRLLATDSCLSVTLRDHAHWPQLDAPVQRLGFALMQACTDAARVTLTDAGCRVTLRKRARPRPHHKPGTAAPHPRPRGRRIVPA